MTRPPEPRRMFEHLEESLLTDCECYGCRNERVGIRKAFQAIRDLYRESTVPKDWTTVLPEGEVRTLGDIADKLIRAIGLVPDEVYEQFIHLLLSRRPYGGWSAERGEWAIRSNKAGLVLDVTVDKDSVLTLEDKDGTCEVRLEFNAGKHITVFEDEERGGWVIGSRGGYCGRDISFKVQLRNGSMLKDFTPTEQTLGDIAIKLGAVVGMHPDEVYDRFIALIRSQERHP